MYTKRAELKAGIVVIVAVAALIALLFYGGGAEPVWRTYRYVHLRFEQGFTAPKVDDNVYMNGAIIGRVYEVQQAQQLYTTAEIKSDPKIRARLSITADEPDPARELYILAIVKMPAAQVIPRGTTAQISRSFTGGRTLALKPGTDVVDLTDAEIRTAPLHASEAVGLEDIAETVNDVVLEIAEFVNGADVVLDEARLLIRTIREKVDALDAEAINEDVKAAVASVRRSLEDFEQRLGPIASDVGDAAGDIKRIAGMGAEAVAEIRVDVKDVLNGLKQVVARLDRILAKAEPKIDVILDDISIVAKNLVDLSKEFNGLGPDARRLIDELGVDLDLFMKTAQDAVRNLADATEDLRANPWKLTNKPDTDEIAFDNLRSATLSYLRAMRDLDEVSRTLTSLLKRPDIEDPAVKARIREALEAFSETQRQVDQTEGRFQELLKQERKPPARGRRR